MKKRKLPELLFQKLYISENTLKCKYKKGFQYLESRFVADRGPIAWLSELTTQRNHIISAKKNLQSILANDSSELDF